MTGIIGVEEMVKEILGQDSCMAFRFDEGERTVLGLMIPAILSIRIRTSHASIKFM